MDKRERGSGRRSRWGAWLLAAALMCALWSGAALAAPAEGTSLIAESAAPKPQITIQGNVVVDKGKPTGFYELALCVRTARTVTLADDGTPVDEEVYAADLAAALASGKPEDREALDKKYNVRNYPFQAASAAMTVNLDALTAVTWGAGTPVYEAWTATGTSTSGTYADHDTDYPRGINTKADGQPDIFTDLSPVENATGGQKVRVRLDTAKPDEVNNATAFIEEMDKDNRTGLLTLSANTTTTRKVVYEVPTPVVVIRFAYDKNRFKNLEVGNPDDLVSEPNTSDFWLGLDRNHPLDGPNASGKTPLTYLGAQATGGAHLYADSDAQVAGSSVFQSVLYTQNLSDDGVTQEPTRFYYYLGAETPSYEGTKREYLVHDEATDADSEPSLYVPTTLGTAILAKRDAKWATAGDPETEAYSFFQNLLTIKDNTKESTLRLILVNAETYRKPTGGVGGAQILFYDWNDDLIGALVVDPEGDARALVNEYVEKTFIHPELRASAFAAGAKDLTELPTQPDYPKYQSLVSSLERDYTYRGDYAYTVGEDNDPNKIFGPDSDEPGEDYPLTDKLDYAFYRRVTTQVEKDVPDPKDPAKTVKTRYYATAPVEVGPDAAFLEEDEEYDGYLYPYVYGWAIVEDETQDLTAKNWILHKDSVKTEDVWTTFGVGELADLDPANTAAQTIPGTTTNYTYAVTEKDAAWYLRFADFSAMEKMLRPGQDVLIVKAVYEPGRSLLKDYNYTVVEDSLHVERYGTAASTEASVYSFQYQYRRATKSVGNVWRGVNRTREPAVQTGYTYDVNAFDDKDKEMDLDPSSDTNVFFLKSLANNDDILNIDLTTGGVLWKLEYLLVDTYDKNIASGVQRSVGEELDLKKNFLYGENVEYPDRQGTDGFVLEATMNTLLAEANKGARGEESALSRHLSRTTLQDMNWRRDETGAEFTAGNYTRATTYLQDLVTRLYNAHESINPETGEVVLGWHQIQRHLLLCMKNGGGDGIYSGGVLMSETACEGFPWCRLDNCAAAMTVDIYTIGDILAAIGQAEGETGDKRPATEALNKLLTEPSSLLDTFWLRKSVIGEKFPESGRRQAVLNALKRVYQVLKAGGVTNKDDLKDYSQEQVQEIIITGKLPSDPVQTYWWANGGKRPVTDWQDFIDAGMLVVSGKVPDALDGMTKEQLPDAVQDMISYKAPLGAPDNVGWFRYKDSQEDDNAFTDVEHFKTKWIKALTALDGQYHLPKSWSGVSNDALLTEWAKLPWEEIQYALINETYQPLSEIVKTANYWWKNGGQPRLTYERMMDAVNDYLTTGSFSKLQGLLSNGDNLNPVNNEVYLRRTAAGTGFTQWRELRDALDYAMQALNLTTNRSDFMDGNGKLKYSTVDGKKVYALDVYQLQYLMLNSTKLPYKRIPTSAEIQTGGPIADVLPDVTCDYWWIPEPHTPTEPQPINSIMDLMLYTYWREEGVGTPPEKIDFALNRLDAAAMTRLGLRAEVHGVPYADEPGSPQTALIDAVAAAVKKLPYTSENYSSQAPATLTKELQYVLLHGAYLNADAIQEDYWWQTGGLVANTHEKLAQAAWLYAIGVGGKTVPDAMSLVTDLDYITQRPNELIGMGGLTMRANLDGEGFTGLAAFQRTITDQLKAAVAGGSLASYEDLTGMNRYQLQYLLLNGEFKPEFRNEADVPQDIVDAYWWFNFDEKPGGGEVVKTELFVEDADWEAFMTAAIQYFCNSSSPDETAFDADPLTDAKLKDVLRLRKGPNDSDVITAAEMFDGSGVDYLWRTLDAMYNSDKARFFAGTKRKRRWQNDTPPTWAEFQYVLLHLDEIEGGAAIPTAEDCAAEKPGYEWMWVSAVAEYEFAPPADADWEAFMTAAIQYFCNSSSPDETAFDADPLTDAKLKDVLRLRKGPNDSDVITAAEMFDGSGVDYLWRALDAMYNSDKARFFAGTKRKRRWQNDTPPTWAEFQYVLLHLDEIEGGAAIPTAEDCVAEMTKENAPWAWQQKAAGASLLSLEEEPPVPLAAMPDDVLTTDIVENGPMGASGPTMGNDDPDASDEPISVGRDDPGAPEMDETDETPLNPDISASVGPDALIGPTPDETPIPDETAEIPLGDEMVAVQSRVSPPVGSADRSRLSARSARSSGPTGAHSPLVRGGLWQTEERVCLLSQSLPLTREVARRSRDGGRDTQTFTVGRDDSARRMVAGPGGASPSPTSSAAMYSANDLAGSGPMRTSGPTIGIDDPDAPTTNERSIMCLMAGPTILPLSLRRTTR